MPNQFNWQIFLTQTMNLLSRYPEVTNIAKLRNKKGENIASNNTMVFDKDIPDQTIVQFTTSSATFI